MPSIPRVGIDYLPDGFVEPSKAPWPLWLQIGLFVAVFASLQGAWSFARGTVVEQIVVHQATVNPAAALVRLTTPQIAAKAIGSSIQAPGGGINILNGCEGVEVMFLLIAAFSATQMNWRHRSLGLLIGLVLVFALNQARILLLFHAYRADRGLFDLLHTTVLPAVLVALTVGYFYAVLHHSYKPQLSLA